LSYGVNGAGVALMVLVFAQTGGLTGAEIAVAGGTATLSQKLLEAVFGDQAVRQLTSEARADLLRRVELLLASQRARFDERLDAVLAAPEAGAGLTEAARSVADAARRLLGGRR